MLKETTGNTEMQNRLLYSPDWLRKERMMAAMMDEKDKEKNEDKQAETIAGVINYDDDDAAADAAAKS